MLHRLEHLIRAHVTLCWLALLLIRVAERQAGQTWRRIATELGRLHLVTLHGPAARITQTTALTEAQRAIYAATEIEPPPRLTALEHLFGRGGALVEVRDAACCRSGCPSSHGSSPPR